MEALSKVGDTVKAAQFVGQSSGMSSACHTISQNLRLMVFIFFLIGV